MKTLASKEITLDDSNEVYKFRIGAVERASVNFSYTGADATDAEIEVFAGAEDKVLSTGTYVLATANNLDDVFINNINIPISYIEVRYTANANTEGTGTITIIGG